MLTNSSPLPDPSCEAGFGSNPNDSGSNTLKSVRLNFERDVWSVLDIPIDNIDIAGAVAKIRDAVRSRRRLSFVTPNVNVMMAARRDPELRRMIIDTDLSLADGAPVVALARILGAPLSERVAGSDVFEALRSGNGGPPLRVFFFGGRDGAADVACQRLNSDPEKAGLTGVGALNPGFGTVEAMSTPTILDEINRAQPDFLVVSLGFAKGQQWIHRNQDSLSVPVIAHLGAVVDFTADTIKRAPDLMQKTGLEWAWRIAQENSLWKRYVRDGISLAQATALNVVPAKFRRPALDPSFDAVNVTDANGVTLRLTGQLTIDTRRAAAMQLKSMLGSSPKGGRVTIDCRALGHVDAAGLGLLHILERAYPVIC